MLQSRTISEASFTFVSIREFMVVNGACFQMQWFIFRLRLYYGGGDGGDVTLCYGNRWSRDSIPQTFSLCHHVITNFAI